MTDLSWGILGGLGCGLNWAVTSLVVRSLTGTFTPAGISAVRSTVGGAILIGGLCLIVSGKGGEGAAATRATRRGLALVCSAAAAWAVSATIQKPALLQIPVLAGSALRIPMAGLVLWLTPWTRGTLAALRSSTLRERRQLGTVCFLNAVGSGLFTVAIRYAGVAVGNVLASTSPLFALPLEVWLLKQRPSRRTY